MAQLLTSQQFDFFLCGFRCVVTVQAETVSDIVGLVRNVEILQILSEADKA